MIAVDTNLLVYAHRAGASHHHQARAAIASAAGSGRGWGIAAASIAEFWMVVTHPSSAGGPSSPTDAAEFFLALERSAAMRIFLPGIGHTSELIRLARDLALRGPSIFDLQIAVQARDAGATELWTADRRFRSIPGLRVVPLDLTPA